MSQIIGKQVVLTLKRSIICTTPKHRAFMQTLGLSVPATPANANTPPTSTGWSSSCPISSTFR